MRIVRLHEQGTPQIGRGTSSIQPNTSLVSLIAQLDSGPGEAVSATLSVLGEVNGFAPEAILFGGASIISMSGTKTAQWTGQVLNNRYSDIYVDLLTVSSLSFQAAATEADR
mgnify:CR=1 FL=1